MKKKTIVSFLATLAAFVLELLPWGAVLRFGQPEGGVLRKTYSYFSLVPFGYANFYPFLTAILTCLLLANFALFFIRRNEKNLRSAFYLSVAGAMVSLLPLMYGIGNFSFVGLGITLSLGVSALLLLEKDFLK